MWSYTLRRFVAVVPVVLVVISIIFLLIHMAPGDPLSLLLSDDASPATIAEVRLKWGLDQPLWRQYLNYLSIIVTGDLGISFKYGDPVVTTILSRLPATVELAIAALLIAVVIAIPLGLWAGSRPNSWIDNLGSSFGFLGISMPSFWLGIVFILLFSGILHLLPSSGRDSFGIADNPITGLYLLDSLLQLDADQARDAFTHLVMPATVLGINMVGMLMRVTRSSIIEIMHEDYITTARAKGAPERQVLWRHGFKNAFIPILTVVGLELGTLLSGSIIIETVFAWPGMGSLLISAISGRDYPLVIGTILTYTLAFVVINFVIDMIYPLVDPRIRLS
jgi:ABC-type dipeptide/oligopeptide/nickel transport system permease component